MGPGQGGSRSDRVGRKEIIREVIGPGPGRVPGLFRQKRGVSFISDNSLLCRSTFQYICV